MFTFSKNASRKSSSVPTIFDRAFIEAAEAAERDCPDVDYAAAEVGSLDDSPIEHRSGGWLARKAEGQLPATDLTGHRGLVL